MQCTQYKEISDYRDSLARDVYACMEFSKQSYTEAMCMPVQRFHGYMKWKVEVEEEKAKSLQEEMGR